MSKDKLNEFGWYEFFFAIIAIALILTFKTCV